jgi:hypothetical protein
LLAIRRWRLPLTLLSSVKKKGLALTPKKYNALTGYCHIRLNKEQIRGEKKIKKLKKLEKKNNRKNQTVKKNRLN